MKRSLPTVAALAVALLPLAACGGSEAPAEEAEAEAPVEEVRPGSRLAQLLADGEVVFGAFARPQNAEGGVAAAQNRETDFIFYSLESGPWDIPTMESFMTAMADSSPVELFFSASYTSRAAGLLMILGSPSRSFNMVPNCSA